MKDKINMPKLLQICIEVNSGSVGRIAEQIGETAIERNWESYIAYARKGNPSKSEVLKIGNKFDLYFHAIETRLFDNHSFGSVAATSALVEKIREIQPDIIHLHHLHGYYINIRILFRYLSESKIPVVWTFHDCWSFTGHCAYFDFVGCNKWKTECHHCEQKLEYPRSLFIDHSRRNFLKKKDIFNSVSDLTIVSVSRWLNDKVKESFFQNAQLKMIYNGVDIESFYPKSSRVDIDGRFGVEGKFLLLGVATTWEKRKRLDDFIELGKSLDKNYVILLVGLNERQIKSLPKGMIGLSRTNSQDELCSYYSAADLFLNLSVEETFGLTTAEAFACGTPSVVYNATACPELVNDETGFVVEKQNIIELINTIEKARSMGKQHFSEACRRRAITFFNKKTQFVEYYNLYNEILNRNYEK